MRSLWLYFDPLLCIREKLQCKIHTSQESGTGFDTVTFSTHVCVKHIWYVIVCHESDTILQM